MRWRIISQSGLTEFGSNTQNSLAEAFGHCGNWDVINLQQHNKALQTDSQQRHSVRLLTAKLVLALLAAAELVVVLRRAA
jgi:hypothetical protein